MPYATTGQRNVLVTFVQQASTPTNLGAPAWTQAFQAYARVKDLTASLLYQSGTFSDEVLHCFTIAYPATLPTTAMQITFNGRTFRIQRIVNTDQRNVQLDVYAYEITSTS